jgi:ubiquinol-cytochrome c reductase cytochrome c1 subunit
MVNTTNNHHRSVWLAPLVLALVTLAAPGDGFAAGGGYELDSANNDVANTASLQRGARNFMNYCSGCHSAQYVRYDTLVDGLGLTEQQVIDNLMFNADKTHETMSIAMRDKDAKTWFNQVPPDLSLIGRSKGADYIYTFLRTYYVDDSSRNGFNNAVLKGVSMPHVLWELEGLKRPVYETHSEGEKASTELVGFEAVTAGTLTAEEYDTFVRDIANFLDYIAEPMQLKRKTIGVWVMLFLLVFFIFSLLLKKQIWKDVSKDAA